MFFSEEVIEQVNKISPDRILDYSHIYYKRVGIYLSLPCPIHHGKDQNFKVNMDTYRWTCFSHRCVFNTGNIGFIQVYKNMSFTDAVRYLADIGHIILEGISESEARAYKIKNKLKRETVQSTESSKKKTEKKSYKLYIPENNGINHPAIKSKGLLPSTLQAFDVYFNERMNRVIFLIKHENGRPVSYKGRAITEEDLRKRKFTSTKDYVVDTLYGLWVTAPFIKQKREIILLEGQWDVLKLFENGVYNVGGTMGNSLLEVQADWIKDNGILKVRIAHDKDFDIYKGKQPPGETLIMKAYEYLGASCEIEIIDYPGYGMVLKGEDKETKLYSVSETRLYSENENDNIFLITAQEDFFDSTATRQYKFAVQVSDAKEMSVLWATDNSNIDIKEKIVDVIKYKDPDSLPTDLLRRIFL